MAKTAANGKTAVDERQKFLDFFVITRTVQKPTIIPDNYQGKVENGVYRNDYFDFSIDAVRDWKVLNENETDLVKEASKDWFRGKDGNVAPTIQQNYRRTAILLMQYRYPLGTALNPGLLISVETTTSPKRPVKDTALLGQKFVKAYANRPFEVTKETAETLLDGKNSYFTRRGTGRRAICISSASMSR